MRSDSLLRGFLVACLASAGSLRAEPRVLANGLFHPERPLAKPAGTHSQRIKESPNGLYHCRYAHRPDGTVQSLAFFAGGRAAFILPETGAHALEVSNAGIVLLIRIDAKTETPSLFTFYSREGRKLMERSYRFPEFSRFSEAGDHFGVCGKDSLEVLHPASGVARRYRTGRRFDVSDDGSVVAVAYENGLSVYSGSGPGRHLATGFLYNRDVRIASGRERVALIDVRQVRAYALPDLRQVLADSLKPEESFRQLRFGPADTLWAGVKHEDAGRRAGLLRTYRLRGGSPFLNQAAHAEEPVGRSGLDWNRFRRALGKRAASAYPSIPWPFKPQDKPHKIWNNYEGLNSSENGIINTDYPYLHQGLDIEVDAHTPVYTVDTGIVKYYGDLGGAGDLYWRIAVARNQSSGVSNGWLYAHLEKGTINYDVGDRIASVGLHIADIVPWVGDISGHLHFAEIRDQGAVWSYTDGEWGITINPQLALVPNPDSTKPVIVQAIAGKSKFAYCPNNSGYGTRAANYFYPDSARGGVKGNIDVVVRLYDYIVYNNHTQPAHRIRYWIKGIGPGNRDRLIVDTTLGMVRNHAYDYFSVAKFKPASEVLYKVDSVFVVGGWFNRTRNFAHILTNNNGDSVLSIAERDSSLRTARYPDGWYRIYVRASDAAGNAVVDSESVYFNNGTPVGLDASGDAGKDPSLLASSQTARGFSIRYGVGRAGPVSLALLDLAGREVATLASGWHVPGEYAAAWEGAKGPGAGRNVYFLVLRSGKASVARKLIRDPT